MLVYFNADDLRKQAEASTKRFQQGFPFSKIMIFLYCWLFYIYIWVKYFQIETPPYSISSSWHVMVLLGSGNPISILDGIFIAIKDDIDCFPYPSKG